MANRSALPGSRIASGLALIAVVTLSACEKDLPTSPSAHLPPLKTASTFTISSGLTAYTDRAAWEAAVTAANSSAQLFDFSALTLGRVTTLDTNYGTFHLTVDRVSADPFSNPGITRFNSCSLNGGGFCNEFIFNMEDPTSLILDMPRVNTIVFPQNVIAFGGNFGQLGFAGGSSTVTGPVTLHFGTESVIVNDYLNSTGYGFFGVVSTVPSSSVWFTFAKSSTIVNDLVELYQPAFANQPAPVGPGTVDEQLAALNTYLNGTSFPRGNASFYYSKLADIQSALAANNKNSLRLSCKFLDQFKSKLVAPFVSPTDATALMDMADTLGETIGC